jgi:hypothetical protein
MEELSAVPGSSEAAPMAAPVLRNCRREYMLGISLPNSVGKMRRSAA